MNKKEISYLIHNFKTSVQGLLNILSKSIVYVLCLKKEKVGFTINHVYKREKVEY